MLNQDTTSTKEELLALLQDLIRHVNTISEDEIKKGNTKFNLEKGLGYLIDDEDYHLWLVKFSKQLNKD